MPLFALRLPPSATTVDGRTSHPSRRWRRLAFAIALCVAQRATCSAAGADQISTDVGLTLNPILGGVHESFNDLRRLPVIPIPLLEFRARDGPIEIDAGGLPAIASFASSDALQGRTSTQLSIFEGAVRVWDPLRRFSAAIGQTVYNQSTRYFDAVEIAGTGEVQFSRVTGLTYQIGYRAPFTNGQFEATFLYAPAMLGIQRTTYDIASYPARTDPEKADQIDTAVRYVRRIGSHGELGFGFRYVDYTARYRDAKGGLSDRNVGLLAVIGFRQRLGR